MRRIVQPRAFDQALQSMDVRWPGKALTLHVHPALRAGEINELDVPVALALLAIRKNLGPRSLSGLVSTGMLGLTGDPAPSSAVHPRVSTSSSS